MHVSNIFNQLLHGLSRDMVRDCILLHDSDSKSRSFKTWDHLVVLLYAQLSGAKSLRDIELLFNRYGSHHYHLGCNGEVKRSTLSDSNNHRNSGVFKRIVERLITSELSSRSDKQECEALLTLLDSSPIRLDGRGHEWAEATCTQRNVGLKLHLAYEPEEKDIHYIEVSDENVNDVTIGQTIPLEAGRVYVFDKAYMQFMWWKKMIDVGSHFVTRLKKNTAYKVIETRSIAGVEEDNDTVIRDEVIMLTGRNTKAKHVSNPLLNTPLRLVHVKHPSKPDQTLMIVSSDLDAPASTIAHYYKKRWDIELLFKWIKQNLKIKTFIGESKNAIMSQIYVALIAYILINKLKKLAAIPQLRLKDVAVICQNALFQRINLLRPPDENKPKKHNVQQLNLWNSI